jgi:hypothetical protein
MEDKWATMGAKVVFVESKVFAMSEYISIIKELLMQKNNTCGGCRFVTPKDPPPNDVAQIVATPLVEGTALKDYVGILDPSLEIVKPTFHSLKVGLGGLSVNTPQLGDSGLNASSWSTVLLETLDP